jgi:hypothetical protein
MTSAGSEPGWYFDPDGGDHERFWNGEASTEHRRSKPLTSNPTPDRVSEPRSHRRDDERLPLQDEADAQGGAPDGEDVGCGAHLEDLAAARDRLDAARGEVDEAKAIAKRAALQAHHNGTFETTIANSLGVDRMTVRRWLGKR